MDLNWGQDQPQTVITSYGNSISLWPCLWSLVRGTNALYLKPCTPWQNGIVESVNSQLRDELLSSEIFESFAEAKYLCKRWRLGCNHRRPQRALGNQTPAKFASNGDEGALLLSEPLAVRE